MKSQRMQGNGAVRAGSCPATRLFPLSLLLLCFLGRGLVAELHAQTPPPRPLLPIPTARQLAWQYDEMRMFVHFGVNTFTDREWGTGEEDPALFRPARLDTDQWARVASETGFGAVVLTAKHHDGFTLWPSRYTAHSVDRELDVVGALAASAERESVKLGLYLSPWDRHEPSYGDEAAYNAFYMGQLRELLTSYGPLAEVWFDGAKGEDAEDMDYDFDAYWSMVRQLQPGAVIFSDAGPDVRWIGNEHGFAGETNWSTFDRSKVSIGAYGIQDYLNTGEAGGPDWVPGECDTSIRPGWFWHADEEPKSLERLLEIYFKSVGRNCVLLLNVPPDDRGRLADADVARLREFRAALDRIFGTDLTEEATATADGERGGEYEAGNVLDGDLDTFWTLADGVETGTLTLELDDAETFNVVRLQEPVAYGQRVARYRVEAVVDGTWRTISEGTTIGHKKLDRLETPITSDRLRIHIEEARAVPLLAELGLHLDPFGREE
jgi:alpha-L-fucosidase